MRAAAIQQIESAVQLAAPDNYVLIASFAVYIFERSIVLSEEANYLWRHRFSVVPVLVVVLHVATTVNFSLLCFENLVDLDCTSALRGTLASQVALTVFDAAIAAITALRVYAINGRHLQLPAVVLALSLIRAAYDLFGTATKTTEPLPAPLGCAVESTSSYNGSFFIASVICSSVADAIVLLVTWHRTYRARMLNPTDYDKPNLSFLLWRDGTVYFGSLLIISILDMVVYTAVGFQGFQYLRLAFSTIILSRFFLNLREAGDAFDHTEPSRAHSTSSPSRGVDTLGGSLVFIGDDVGDSDFDDETAED